MTAHVSPAATSKPCAAILRPRLDARRVPGGAVVGDPRAPTVVTDLRDRVEVRAERANPPRLVGPEVRLVRGQRRDRNRVLRARRLVRGELRREPQPVRRGVENEPQRRRAVLVRSRVAPLHELAPQLRSRLRLQRRDGLSRAGARGRCKREHRSRDERGDVRPPRHPHAKA